jgi:hypothetical protein
MASEAERYLRGMAVDRLRALMPEARIVHELNVEVGTCRVDLAAVAPDRLVFVEVKSRKDKLDRLAKQAAIFAPACHRLVVCYASERWDVSTIYSASDYLAEVWPQDRQEWWSLRDTFKPPNTSAMPNLLWRDELHDEAVRASLQPTKRAPRQPLMAMLWEHLTGRQVVAAVCRQLRARHFPAADPPVSL